MKTTLEIPDAVFRRAKSKAAERGIPLRQFVTEAVEEKLRISATGTNKPWMKHIGKLKHLRKETKRVERLIEDSFEQIEPENWK
jgi:hypothetical protein